MSIRVRIAPSPTGPIHVGNVHTALFNWLWARNVGGQFILRFEDTDQERSKREWERVVIEDLTWLGLDWDEGPYKGGPYAPYRQMERLDMYREYANKLETTGKAYRCYCTKEEEDVDRKAAQAENRPYQYKGRCRHLTPEQRAAFEAEGRTHLLRFPVPRGRVVAFDDIVRGRIEVPTDSIGDFVIMRANGIPLYNFAVVVDDLTMKITHVLRGEGHISNTPVQLLIYEALGEQPPVVGHVGHMTNEDRGKLSKRKGEAAVQDYREDGYLPEALLNFMALLGWTPPGAEAGREFLTRAELIAEFDVRRLTKAPSIFDRNKLNWMNGAYIRKKSPEQFAELALPFVTAAGLTDEQSARSRWEWFVAVLAQTQARVVTLKEVPQHVDYFFRDIQIDSAMAANLLTDAARPFFHAVINGLRPCDWTIEAIEQVVRSEMDRAGLKPKESIQTIRVAITGRTASPGLFEVIHLLGRERTIERMQMVL